MTESFAALLWITLTFTLAGWVKGVVGMGLPTVAMGLLGLVMVPVEAAALLVIPSLVTNLWQLATGPRFLRLLRRLILMMIGICAGTAVSIGILASDASALASATLGAVLAAYGMFGLLAPRFSVPARAETWLSPLVGVATGVVTGATGIFVIPAVPYLGSLGLEKEELIQALGLSFTVSTLALGAGIALTGSMTGSLAWGSVLAVVPALIGMYLGQAVRDRLRPDIFRRWFFAALILLGIYMLVRAIGFA